MSRILVSLGGNALGADFDELVESVGNQGVTAQRDQDA